MRRLISLFAVAAVLTCVVFAQSPVSLFDGKTLNGWTKGGITPAKGYLCLQAEVPGGGQFLFKNITMLEL